MEAALFAVSPIDGRYSRSTKRLSEYFSEYALFKYRCKVEVEYFLHLTTVLPQLKSFDSATHAQGLRDIYEKFDIESAKKIKEEEAVTNHDVKAVEYFVKKEMDKLGLKEYREWVHFSLTSQDINNTAIPLLFKDAIEKELRPSLQKVLSILETMSKDWMEIPMLAHTHGQPATPTRVGKEFQVFRYRIMQQLKLLEVVPHSAKFGGATGQLNAHVVALPSVDWLDFADKFVASLGLEREQWTTQISNYDNLGATCDALKRINTILLDLCKDMWHYISIEYFKQKIIKGEVGSSAMPHKVNPIDFENAEGNLGLANAAFEHFSSKLPVSRLQRDLTDSTVLRNLGVPIAYTLIALNSLDRGLNKVILNTDRIQKDLTDNFIVVSEAIQTVLRREGFDQPYEKVKELTRKGEHVTPQLFEKFVDELEGASDELKAELKQITPQSFIGVVPQI